MEAPVIAATIAAITALVAVVVGLASYLNVLGLVVTTLAASLMWLYPPRIAYYTEKGAPHIQWVNSSLPAKATIGKWQMRLSKTAPVLLCIGFALQLPSAVISAWPIR